MSEKTPPKRISSFFLAIIFIVVLALSILALFKGMTAITEQDITNGSSYILIGVGALALSAYMLFQTKRVMPQLMFEPERVATTILCNKCGFKNLRDFQRGDYILKEAEPCPKCNEKMIIASIYREVKEKEKESL
jgi:hypothetical protein